MACDTVRSVGQSLAAREAEVKGALRRLEQALAAGQARVVVGPTGAVAFQAWADRAGLSDACAYRVLTVEGSWILRQAVARAEAMGGRKVNTQAVAAGHHSHDGGRTWGRGH